MARYAAVWSKNYRLKTAAASLVEMAKHYSSGQTAATGAITNYCVTESR